jgi:ABC-2 type transport system permease protein
MIQLLVCFAAGSLLFGVQVLPHLPLLLLVSLFTSAACVGFGMLIASVSTTTAAASGLSTFLILTQSALGGAFFPVSMMPEFIQGIARFTIVFWAQDGFVRVLWDRQGIVDLLPTLGVLGGVAATLLGAALWRFRRGQVFS